MVKVFKEAVKCPVRRKRQGNIKTAVMSDEKVVVQVIDKVGYHGEAFASGFRVFPDKGQIEI